MIGSLPRLAAGLLQDLVSQKRASVAVMIAASTVPIATALAFSFDFGRYLWIKSKFDQVADASALYAVSKPLLTKNKTFVSRRVKTFFTAQIRPTIASQNISLRSLSVKMSSAANGKRQIDIRYEASMPTLFLGLLGFSSFPIGGVRSAENGLSPYIDFHILLDNSPSMAFPSTHEGLDILATTNSTRCLFACHNTAGTKGIRRDGSTGDLYSVARSYNLPLRLEKVSEAVSDLTRLAEKASIENDANYRMSVFKFSHAIHFEKLADLTRDYTKISESVKGLEPPLFWSDSCLYENCPSDDPREEATASSYAFEQMNKYMADPGSGQKNSTPQEIFLVITDGMRDEHRVNNVPEIVLEQRWCDIIKNRGIRIGILYTVYSLDS